MDIEKKIDSEDEDELTRVSNLKNKFDNYEKYFSSQPYSQANQSAVTSYQNTFRSNIPFRSQSVQHNITHNESKQYQSEIPIIKNSMIIERSLSAVSGGDSRQSSTSHSQRRKKQYNSGPAVKQAYSMTEDNEYFPIPFKNNDSIQQNQRIRLHRAKRKQRRHQFLKEYFYENNKNSGNSMDKIDEHFREVQQMSQNELEKLVFKPYSNIHAPSEQFQSQKSFLRRQIQSKSELKINQDSSIFNNDQTSQQIIRSEKDSIQIEEDEEDQEIKLEPQQQVEFDELGFVVVRPYFIDKKKNIVLDRMLGLLPDQEMNEQERQLLEKRQRLESEYQLDQEKAQKIIQKKDDIIDDEEHQDYLIRNFLKIYEREPIPKTSEGTSPKSVNTSARLRSRRSTILLKDKKIKSIRNADTKSYVKKDVNIRLTPVPMTNEEIDDIEPFKKRLRETEVLQIKQYIEMRGEQFQIPFQYIDCYLRKLSFFAKYPYDIRKQLLDECRLQIYETGEQVFQQGDSTPEFYVILRGSTKAILIKKDYGNIPVIVSTFYDGREFGEVTLYEVSQNLTQDMVIQLNKQKYTCETMEQSYIIALEKEKTNKIINSGMQTTFEQRIDFLKQIDIFHMIDLHILLPLANNLQILTFKLGEYILKEGEQPLGLYIISKGQCKVGSTKLNMRQKHPFNYGNLNNQLRNFKFKGNFQEQQLEVIQQELKDNERQDTKESDKLLVRSYVESPDGKMRQDRRIFQNDRVLYDEKGKKIKDHIVYKDFVNTHTALFQIQMTFFTLTMKDYFGGKSLLINNDNFYFEYDENTGTRSKKKVNKDEFCSLSVIADSSEVELLLMDSSQMSFFPEKIQKEIYHRVEQAFQPDQPYQKAIVEKIKDKFREWEKYKLETVNSILKQSYAEKKKGQILSINR